MTHLLTTFTSRARGLAFAIACLAGISLGALPAAAQQATPDATSSAGTDRAVAQNLDRDTVTVGAVGAYLPDYEGSDDYRATPAPVAIGSVKGYSFVLTGNQLAIDLIRDESGPRWDFQAGPIASLNFNRSSLKDITDLRVRVLGKRDTALELCQTNVAGAPERC